MAQGSLSMDNRVILGDATDSGLLRYSPGLGLLLWPLVYMGGNNNLYMVYDRAEPRTMTGIILCLIVRC